MAVALAAGCATATIEDAVPVAAIQDAGQPESTASEIVGDPEQEIDANLPATVSATPASRADSPEMTETEAQAAITPGRVRDSGGNTGIYPNLNIKPGVANKQISPLEKQAKLAELEAKRRAQAAHGAANRTTINQARLRRLAATNANEVLTEIEGE